MNQIDERIKSLYNSGYSRKTIAEKTGISFASVCYRIRKMRNKGIQVERWWK